jgi:Aerotolerance regulator N-terminal
MIWQNPWAWLGLTAIAIPILVHLLARRQAVRVRFPTLRFLPVAPITAVRRHRLTDLALLAVRIAILTAAVAALAQPYIVTAGRGRAASALLSRAIVIDTSASMARLSADGRPAREAARAMATTLEPRADSTTTIETDRLTGGLDAALPWLERAPGRREVVVISDFQRSALTSDAVRVLPADVSVRLIKVDVAQSSSTTTGPAMQVGARNVTSQTTLAPDRTDVEWTTSQSGGREPVVLRTFAGAAERSAVDAAIEAARATGVPATPLSKPVVLVFPAAPERAALIAGARAIDQPWMFDAIDRVRRDRLVAAAAQTAGVPANEAGTAPNLVAVITTSTGRALVSAASAEIDGAATLLFFPTTSEGLLPAALAAGVLRAEADSNQLAELEPETIPADTLRQWERPTGNIALTNASRRPPDGASDGRWLWALALTLLALETWMRRTKPHAIAVKPDHARVA